MRANWPTLAAAIRAAKAPLIVAGGGVLYSRAEAALAEFAAATGIPVAETQAGKGALAWDHPQALGSIGVTGTSAANAAAEAADLVIGIGTRLQDFTTGSRTLFGGQAAVPGQRRDARRPAKHGARRRAGRRAGGDRGTDGRARRLAAQPGAATS